ncbi:MAG: aspartate kinase [Methanomassiliicoccales archaeon]
MKVLKFGGSSLRDGESMRMVGDIVLSEGEPKVVVVSAVQSVTDQLLEFMSKLRSEKEVQEFVRGVQETHVSLLKEITKGMETKQQAVSQLMERLVKLERVLYGICYLEELTPRTRDMVQSFGEKMAVILVSGMLQDVGVNAVPLCADDLGIITDGVYGSATADLEATRANIREPIRERVERGEVPVITGFFGRTDEGHITLFGRNGTDYSASVIGHAVDADLVEIWKDVDGFMSVDPRVVPSAVPIDELSYEEAAELSYFGAQVLHPRTVEPARKGGIAIRLMNVFKPEAEGTLIHGEPVGGRGSIKSVSCMRGMAIVKAYGASIGYRYGVISKLANLLMELEVNIYSAATSQTCISLLVDRSQVPRVKRHLVTHASDLVDRFEVVGDVSLVCVVGEGLGYTDGLAAKVFNAVARERVNIGMISAGASMVAYCFTVAEKELERTIRSIHGEFFGGDDD